MIKKIDKLGRLVIPKELRMELNLRAGEPLRIEVEGGRLVLEPHRTDCVFCGGTPVAVTYKGKNVCRTCLEGIISKEAG